MCMLDSFKLFFSDMSGIGPAKCAHGFRNDMGILVRRVLLVKAVYQSTFFHKQDSFDPQCCNEPGHQAQA